MKNLILILCIFALVAAPAMAKKKGHISVNAKMELYNPPGDDLIAPMFTVQARYRMSAFFAAVGNASWTKYKIAGNDVTFVPLSVDGELHPMGKSTFDPYLGAGIGANYRQVETQDPEINIGADLLGGLIWKPEGYFGVDVSLRYRIEDIANPSKSGSWTVGGGVTGSWEKDL
jgi:outer membrane protein W